MAEPNLMPEQNTDAMGDPAWLLGLFRGMLRIRLVEEEIARRYDEQEMRCPVHLSIGQEAAAIGACTPLRQDDQIVSTHRCHSHYLAKGGDLGAMMAEIYGKATGCCGGRGGSMHLFDRDAGILASVPIVSSSIPLGVGAALAFQQRNENKVALVFLGDGSMEEGVFHESANFASLFRLPVVFMAENNLFSVYTHLSDRQPERPLTDVAQAHAMPAAQVDGNRVLDVYAAADEAVSRARGGEGPSLIVADTYRWREHCGPNYDNDIGYRTSEDFDAWKVRCPVSTFAETLKDRGILDDAAIEAMNREITEEVTAAFTAAQAAPFPDPATAGDGVYA